MKPALALSLHTTKPELRRELLPRAPRLTPDEIVEAGERYARATGYPIQYQWTLLEGVNDGDDELDGIVRLLKGRYGVLNMIPFNAVDGVDFRRPTWDRAAGIARSLHRRGVLTKRTQELELYRANDTSLIEPFPLRLLGLGIIEVETMEQGNFSVRIGALANANELREHLRTHIERCRDRKRVRMLEMDEPGVGD